MLVPVSQDNARVSLVITPHIKFVIHMLQARPSVFSKDAVV
jgi:hypothetical protein